MEVYRDGGRGRCCGAVVGCSLLLGVLLVASVSARETKRKHFMIGDPQSGASIEAPVLGVVANISPYISVSVYTVPSCDQQSLARAQNAPHKFGFVGSAAPDTSADCIRFQATGGPGLYDADKEVVLFVQSNSKKWVIVSTAAPLDGANGTLPADRVFMRSECTDPNLDEGGGLGYENLGSPAIVCTGGKTAGREIRTRFRLKADWQDRVGTYRGAIYFDYMVKP